MGDTDRVVCKWNKDVLRSLATTLNAGSYRLSSTFSAQANLARLRLDRPEDVFDIRFFRSNPYPFYALAKELYPGKHRPTITHSFVRLLETKGLLGTCFTQNIDTLERRAGVSEGGSLWKPTEALHHRVVSIARRLSMLQRLESLIQEEKIPRCATVQGIGEARYCVLWGGCECAASLRTSSFCFAILSLCSCLPFQKPSRTDDVKISHSSPRHSTRNWGIWPKPTCSSLSERHSRFSPSHR
jgi:hypothetical protein